MLEADPANSPHAHLLALCLASPPGLTPEAVASQSAQLAQDEQVRLTTKLAALLQTCVGRMESAEAEHAKARAAWEREARAREEALCWMAADNVRLRRDGAQRRYQRTKLSAPASQQWLLEPRGWQGAADARRWECAPAQGDEGSLRLAERGSFAGGLGPDVAASLSVGGLPRHGHRACGGSAGARRTGGPPSPVRGGSGGAGSSTSSGGAASVVSMQLHRPSSEEAQAAARGALLGARCGPLAALRTPVECVGGQSGE